MFDLMDEARRQAGRALDTAGLGPQESAYRIVAEMPGARLRAYHDAGGGKGPAVLILPAPFKRPYIWDLLPEVSVVRRCLERDLAVYVLEWTRPGPDEDGYGLADYAERLPSAAVAAIGSDSGRPVVVMGHSVGGTFAAIFASLRPNLVKAVALIDAPLAFGEHGGGLARAVAAMPHAAIVRRQVGSPVPGSAINLLSISALPDAFQAQRYSDLLLSMADPEAMKIHARVERWTLDEFPLPGQLFEDVAELLYRADLFNQGTLTVGGETTGVERIRAPVLAVVNPFGRVVPTESMTVALERLPKRRCRLLTYEGDRGTALQHLGPLVGPNAHRHLWPAILDWFEGQT
jgi:polyhydroxyalkanoate synthase subunit PhaC